jgi:hypothetical protein
MKLANPKQFRRRLEMQKSVEAIARNAERTMPPEQPTCQREPSGWSSQKTGENHAV